MSAPERTQDRTPDQRKKSDKSADSGQFTGRGVGQSNSCSICQEVIGDADKAVLVPCLHQFHKQCIDTWTQDHNTCPECRQVAASVRFNFRSGTEFETRDIPVPSPDASVVMRIGLAQISPHTSVLYIFPIPAMTLVAVSRVQLVRKREGQADQVVQTLEAQGQHSFSVFELLTAEEHFIRDDGRDYGIEAPIALLQLEAVISAGSAMGLLPAGTSAGPSASGPSASSSSSNSNSAAPSGGRRRRGPSSPPNDSTDQTKRRR